MLTFNPIVLCKTGRQHSCFQDQPKRDGMPQFCETLKGEGILCKETHEDTIRFAPPLVITRDQVDWALERIDKVLTGG